MISIRIDNSTVCAGLFGELIKLIETTAGMDYLLAEGCDPEVIDVIRNMKVRDVREIANCMKSFHFSFKAADLSGEVLRLVSKRDDQALCDYFIRNGASRNMVAELWKMSLADVTEMRRLLLAGGSTAGRPHLPRSHAVRQRIHETWSEIGKTHAGESRRRQIYRLHQVFPDLAIESLHSVITEFDMDDDAVSSSRKSGRAERAHAKAPVLSAPASGDIHVR